MIDKRETSVFSADGEIIPREIIHAFSFPTDKTFILFILFYFVVKTYEKIFPFALLFYTGVATSG